MTIPFEILGSLVRELRVRRRAGASAAELIQYLEELNVSEMAKWYFHKAFLLRMEDLSSFDLLVRQLRGDPDALNRALAADIGSMDGEWHLAPDYPDLLSRCDREVFRAVALRRQVTLWVVTPPRSAASGPPEGHAEPGTDEAVLRSPYRLLGIHPRKDQASSWRALDGETIRNELNTAFGEELVRCGVLDRWEKRDETGQVILPASALLPVLRFGQDGNVRGFEDLDELSHFYRTEAGRWPFAAQPSKPADRSNRSGESA